MKPKKVLLYVVKLLVSSLAIFYVLTTVGSKDILSTLEETNIFLFVIALILHILAQYFSTHRLGLAFNAIKVPLPFKENLRLYFIGMAYNLFLPGGIGGDAYKAVYIKNKYESQNKTNVAALLLDRLSGLLAIVLLLCIFLSLCPGLHPSLRNTWILIPAILIAAYYGVRWVFPSFLKAFPKILLFALVVQIIESIVIYCLAMSLNLYALWETLSTFLLSTIATAIPIFIGGFGAREFVFGEMAPLLDLDESVMVGMALLYSVIVLLSALPGLFLDWKSKA